MQILQIIKKITSNQQNQQNLREKIIIKNYCKV
jgi:hypothetical protein